MVVGDGERGQLVEVQFLVTVGLHQLGAGTPSRLSRRQVDVTLTSRAP
jgi:hypothetical protein